MYTRTRIQQNPDFPLGWPPEAIWDAFWHALGRSWEALGSLLVVCGALRVTLGALLGQSGGPLWCSLGALEANLEALQPSGPLPGLIFWGFRLDLGFDLSGFGMRLHRPKISQQHPDHVQWASPIGFLNHFHHHRERQKPSSSVLRVPQRFFSHPAVWGFPQVVVSSLQLFAVQATLLDISWVSAWRSSWGLS